MLKSAWEFKERVESELAKQAASLGGKWFFIDGWTTWKDYVEGNDWNNIQRVSVSADGELVGFLSANVHMGARLITSLSLFRFTEHVEVFLGDFLSFGVELLVDRGFRKLRWNTVIGSPAQRLYDRIIEQYGGRVIGDALSDVQLIDGRYYDRRFYELHRDDFLQHYRNVGPVRVGQEEIVNVVSYPILPIQRTRCLN